MPHNDSAAQDVYTGVAQEVQSIAEQDAKDGMLEAQALLGNIDRKLVKQTVMTSVYGVTWVGAARAGPEQAQGQGLGRVGRPHLQGVHVCCHGARPLTPAPQHMNFIVRLALASGLSAIFVQS